MGTFKLPDLGEGLAEAEIREWHVKPGDNVAVDQPMVSVETAKAVVEVPMPFGGIVTALHGVVGDIVATGAPLIDIAPASAIDSVTVVGSIPATRKEELFESAIVGRCLHENKFRPRAVPVARAVATRLGLDLAAVAGSGSGGVVKLDDVLAHAKLRTTRGNGAPGAPIGAVPEGATSEPLRGARRAMSQSMSASRDQVSGSTVCDDADIESWTRRDGYMPRLIRALSIAVGAEPALNAWYDAGSNSRILLDRIDLGVAVDTPDGLLVPVLRDVRGKSSEELRTAIAAQKEGAHQRRTTPDQLRDFTLMLSNFGTLAGRYGIPLVVPPAVAILGAGKVRQDAVVIGGAVVARWRMPLSLSFDHRCITGGEACRFLSAVIKDLEQPN